MENSRLEKGGFPLEGPSSISKTDDKRDTEMKEVVDMSLRKGIGIGHGN